MTKLNLILDLDNTLICSVPYEQLKKHNLEKKNLKYKDMEDYYRVYYRPHLDKFLEYVFKHFNVTIWTAASKNYASFILDNILLEEKPKKKNIRLFLYDHNCEQSMRLYDKSSPKDLRYLYHFKDFKYHPCNTIILDDLPDVYKANPKQTIRAVPFEVTDKNSEKDEFLLEAMKKLDKIRKKYKEGGCTFHQH